MEEGSWGESPDVAVFKDSGGACGMDQDHFQGRQGLLAAFPLEEGSLAESMEGSLIQECQLGLGIHLEDRAASDGEILVLGRQADDGEALLQLFPDLLGAILDLVLERLRSLCGLQGGGCRIAVFIPGLLEFQEEPSAIGQDGEHFHGIGGFALGVFGLPEEVCRLQVLCHQRSRQPIGVHEDGGVVPSESSQFLFPELEGLLELLAFGLALCQGLSALLQLHAKDLSGSGFLLGAEAP